MKNKGFTLTELLLVIVIIAIITVIAVPGLMENLSENKKQGGKSVENLIVENLKLYNSDNEEDLWCLNEEGFECSESFKNHNCLIVSAKELYSVNPDLDMGDCLLKDKESLIIKKTGNDNYEYYADIVCGKNIKESEAPNYKIADTTEGIDLYYQSTDFPNELKNNNSCKTLDELKNVFSE